VAPKNGVAGAVVVCPSRAEECMGWQNWRQNEYFKLQKFDILR
jgi:hypothetical protein